MEKRTSSTLREYLETAWIWTECLHVERLRDEDKAITKRHADNQRRLIVAHVLKDAICNERVTDLTRADLLELRSRIRRRTTASQTSKTLQAIRTILGEYVYRQELERNPMDGVGKLKESSQEIGVFSAKELRSLFEKAPGIWGTYQAYAAFLLAAATGMRRGEILVLTWGK